MRYTFEILLIRKIKNHDVNLRVDVLSFYRLFFFTNTVMNVHTNVESLTGAMQPKQKVEK